MTRADACFVLDYILALSALEIGSRDKARSYQDDGNIRMALRRRSEAEGLKSAREVLIVHLSEHYGLSKPDESAVLRRTAEIASKGGLADDEP